MRIGIISDTHGMAQNTKCAVELLKKQNVESILHCGDVGGSEVVSQFTSWTTHFVAGNCDDPDELGEVVKSHDQNWQGLFGDLSLGGKQIALLHSHQQDRFHHAMHSGDYDLVCYGHTHQYEWHIVGETHVLNPGAIHRAAKHTIAIVDLETMDIEHLEVQMQA